METRSPHQNTVSQLTVDAFKAKPLLLGGRVNEVNILVRHSRFPNLGTVFLNNLNTAK
jgi:hypothetical protein